MTAQYFSGKVVILGLGQVARCFVQILGDTLGDLSHVTVVDRVAEDTDTTIRDLFSCDYTYLQAELGRENLAEVLASVAGRCDLVVNLTAGVCSPSVIEITSSLGCLYVDSSIEPWEDQYDGLSWPEDERGSYGFICRQRERIGHFGKGTPTSVVTHGANPGLVNHFTKQAINEIAVKQGHAPLAASSAADDWAQMCQRLGISVIHISEQDTQSIDTPRAPRTFLNTWAVEAFWAESMCPGEMGWGTHEGRPPAGGHQYTYAGKSGAWFEGHAADLRLMTWAPDAGEFDGAAIPHPECLTLTEYLTVKDGDRRVYAPTVVFVYRAAPEAEASLSESQQNNWQLQSVQRVMSTEIISGIDELGVLVMPQQGPALWVGSQLSIGRSRAFAPTSNATVLQVAAGVLGACKWAVQNPDEGFCEPEDLPYDFVLDVARPFIAPFVSVETYWPYESGKGKSATPFALSMFLKQDEHEPA